MHRTYFRTFTTTAAMVLVSFLLIGAAFGFASRQVFVSEARESMMTNSREISRMAVAYAAEGDLRSLELRMTLSTIGASTNQHIFIVNPSGYIITCSDSAVFCEHIGKRLDESVTAILPQSGTVASLGTLGGFYASEHYTVISALTDDGALLGHLFVSKDTVTALSIWETILPLFFFISLIVLCLALIFSYASSKYFAKPLRDMADAARRFGRGELNVRVEPTDSTDEIGELTEAFNSMADSLEQSETKRREFIANVSHELKTPMTTISGFADGILDGRSRRSRKRNIFRSSPRRRSGWPGSCAACWSFRACRQRTAQRSSRTALIFPSSSGSRSSHLPIRSIRSIWR